MSIYQDIKIYTARKTDEITARHSEATILERRDKKLLMVWQSHYRTPLGGADEAPSVLLSAISSDNGATWQNERTVASMKDGCVNVYSPNLFRLKSGRILLLFKRYMHLVWGEEIRASTYIMYSDDEGETWSKEKTIWENSKIHTHNDTILRLRDGSIVFPIETCDKWDVDGQEFVSVMRSDDELETFTQSNWITCDKRGLMEPCIAELNDGKLVMVMRTQLGFVYISESVDGGRTWTQARASSLDAPESCPCVAKVPNSDAILVVWNNHKPDNSSPTHGGRRNPLTLAISRDGLKTFTDFYDLETDYDYAFTNPSILVTEDGLFIMNYWTCKYNEKGFLGGDIDLKIATFRVKV